MELTELFEDRKKFYFQISELEERELAKQIQVLSNQISDSSEKKETYFLDFRNRELNEREFYLTCLGLGHYRSFFRMLRRNQINISEEERTTLILLHDIYEWFDKQIKRFEKCKFSSFFISYYKNCSITLYRFKKEAFPPPREYYYNFYLSSKEKPVMLRTRRYERILRIGFPTKRKAKKAAFIRGYRDHGSRLDFVVKARRLADQEKYLQDIFLRSQRLSQRYKNPQEHLEEIRQKLILQNLLKFEKS